MSENLVRFIPKYTPERVIHALSEVTDWGIEFTGIKKYKDILQTNGEEIKVAILDTGANKQHPDLAPNFKGCEDFTGENDPDDHVGHSSHVAGIIGAADNDIGVIGVAPKCSLYTGKVLNNQGLCPPDYSWIIKGLEWAIDIKADVVNMSLGAPIVPPDKLLQTVRKATSQGMIIVAASGNEQLHAIDFPGRYDEVISVAAMDKSGNLAHYSNIGPALDFIAPGSDVYSTYLNNGYSCISGTCLPETSCIFTPDGMKYLNEIQEGDSIISCDPKTLTTIKNKVSKKWSNGIKQIYKIKNSNWSLEATGNHPVLTLDVQKIDQKQGCGLKKEYGFIWKRIDELTLDDYIVFAHNINISDEGFVDSIPSADFAQFLGFMIGDGWVSSPKSGMYMISFSKGVYEHINDEYKKLLEQFSVNKVSTTKDGNQIYTYDKNLYYILSHFGLDDGAKHKRFPEEIFKCSSDIRKAFIIGYLDADGASPKKVANGTISFSSASERLVLDLKHLLATVGAQTANVYHRYRESKLKNGRVIKGHEYSATICRSEIEKIFEIESDGNIAIKRAGSSLIDSKLFMQKILDSEFRIGKITDIEVLDEREVFDIEMENKDYPCFIADGIVVHNSMASPFIAGVCALLLAYHRDGNEHGTPIHNYQDIIDHIKKFEKGKLIDFGNGKGIGILDFNKCEEKNISISSLNSDFDKWKLLTYKMIDNFIRKIFLGK